MPGTRRWPARGDTVVLRAASARRGAYLLHRRPRPLATLRERRTCPTYQTP